ncbi:GNAT family N-acetyltransferase [Alteromonas sp. 5E99-2]|uniref:GNAT family N-acetyltransferase n=1 Tax=Alteromonas sp. 5E99-2 TaxID=2817683 RepID=UPI001A99A274|nr:GNAT family N-acetyltransferase [Alteromonas sp. 5E99-2]MBO1255639.1 GNAT family N-acetyltransferase [Alteromonas sp. 5E99-2]
MQNNENREFPKLTTSRLLLDPLTMKDAKDVFAIFSDPRVIKNYDVQIFKDISEAEGLIDYFYLRFESDTGIRWAIRDKQTGELIGSCGFNTWNPYDHCAVVGYELAPQFWGKGYASEAVSAILDFIFAKSFYFYVNRVEALILPQNKPSAQLVKKLGFALDGVMRGKTYWNDDFHDIAMYSMLNKQWHAR